MSLRDQLDINSETWRPNATDKQAANPDHPQDIVGTIVEIDQFDTEYGQCPAFVIKADDGNYWRWVVVGEVAQKRIATLDPRTGDDIGVRYLGRVPSPNRKDVSYHDWRIVLERGETAKASTIAQQQLALAEEPF